MLDDLTAPGAIIAGKYSVVRVLGKGGMGVVVEARHVRLNQSVALKILVPSSESAADVTTRFEREARAVAQLSGPHVAHVLDVDSLPDGKPFMVMELLHGRELSKELATQGKLPVRDAVGYILQACAGMAEAHRMGIIHRDLKPSNLFLSEHEGLLTLKVLDFGISKVTSDVQASVTTTASAFGTPLYMSPEQVRSVKRVDARTDIWSLGVVLYELLAGEPPFLEESAPAILVSISVDKPVPIGERRPDVPGPLADAVMKALEKDPNARFPDMRSFAAAIAPYGPPPDDPVLDTVMNQLLAGWSQTSTLAATAQGQSNNTNKPQKRRILAAAAAVVVGLGVTAAILLTSSQRSPPHPGAAEPPVTATAAPIGVDPAAVTPAPVVTAAPLTTAPSTTAPSTATRPTAMPTTSASALSPQRPKPVGPTTSAVPTTPRPPSTDDPKYL
jgi:eukaryotic-like serine/threonine-protein kinase